MLNWMGCRLQDRQSLQGTDDMQTRNTLSSVHDHPERNRDPSRGFNPRLVCFVFKRSLFLTGARPS